jgi:filamentous hemagglutinin
VVKSGAAWFYKKRTLNKKNGRDVYTDSKGNHWSVDTQHGRFEKLDSKGRHLGEYDVDLNPIDNS